VTIRILAAGAAWHYILGGPVSLRPRLQLAGWSLEGWKGDADGAQGKTGGGMRSGASEEAFVIVLGLGQRVEIGDDLEPDECPKCGDAAIQRLLQHEGEKAAERVTADGFVELVEDRPGREQVFRCAEGLLHGPQIFVESSRQRSAARSEPPPNRPCSTVRNTARSTAKPCLREPASSSITA
jgi:hypothetical protein